MTELGLECDPFLRYQRAMIAGAGHPLARLRGPVAVARLLDRPWFAGTAGVEVPRRPVELSRLRISPPVLPVSRCETRVSVLTLVGENDRQTHHYQEEKQ